jgi:flagellin
MLGNGNGTFQARMSFGTGSAPRSVSLGDFNDDGLLDLVAADTSSGTLSVMLGNGNEATFTPYLNINTRQGALAAMEVIDRTLQRISSELGAIGSTQSRLGVALDNLGVARENFDAAAGRIQDADVAAESADLVRTGILQQAAAAVLAQANQQPALALQLLRGG